MFRFVQYSSRFRAINYRYCSDIVFPYGKTEFGKIRKEAQFFVDTTACIPKLEQSGKHIIFSRPKGFGKSLLLSTLQHYYDINEESNFTNLFGELNIYKNPTQEKNKYHILSIDFSKDNHFHETINKNITNFIKKYNINLTLNPNDSLSNLQNLGNILQLKGEKLMILIDEYDQFDFSLFQNNKNEFYELKNNGKIPLVCSFYETIKNMDLNQLQIKTLTTVNMPYFHCDFIDNITQNKEFGNLLGFNKNHIENAFDQLNNFHLQKNQILDLIKSYYNGYSFYGSSEKLYHPGNCLFLLNKLNNNPNILENLIENKKPLHEILNGNHDYLQYEMNLFQQFPKSDYSDEFLSNLLNSSNEKPLGVTNKQNLQHLIDFMYYHGLITLHHDKDDNISVSFPNQSVKNSFIKEINNQNPNNDDNNEKVADINDPTSLLKLGCQYIYGKDKNLELAIQYLTLAADKNNADAQFYLGMLYTGTIDKQIQKDKNKAFTYFELAANQNHIDAKSLLGIAYAYGNDIEQNLQKGIEYLTFAADKNNLDALCTLGTMYNTGFGFSKDYNQSMKYLNLAASQNHSHAQFLIGTNYFLGEGVEKDFKKALEYFLLAANRNHVAAQLNVGRFYKAGFGTEKNLQLAIKFLKLALNKGKIEALIELGEIYDSISKQEAIQYFKLAADHGLAAGQYNLALKYNQGVDKDLNLAFKYFKLAADQNHSDAQSNLALFYKWGYNVVSQDMQLAFKYFKLAADQNDSFAQLQLGEMYEGNFDGIKQDLSLAFKYYKLAADANYPPAQLNIGFLYLHGNGIDKDLDLAFKYLNLAAIDGNYSYAQFELGRIYEGKIDGVEKNMPLAFKYFKLAADQGLAHAQNYIATFYLPDEEQIDGVQKDEHVAFEYIKLAAEQHYAPAQFNIGVFYENGTGVEKDLNQAFKYYKLAADQGHVDAMFLVGVFYFEGKGGIEKDEQQAFNYVKLAADQGHEEAQKIIAEST